MGKKTFALVPERIQVQMKELLADLDVPEMAEEGKEGSPVAAPGGIMMDL